MKNKLSTNLFYVYNIIFYTCLLSSPLSASTQLLLNQKEEPQQYKSLQFNVIGHTGEEESVQKINKEEEWFNAVKGGKLDLAKELKQEGANPQKKDEDGNNALHLACMNAGSEAMVTWLLDVCGIGIETKGRNQITPFLCTAFKGQIAIAKLLRQQGANIHATDGDGNNALHYACLVSGNEAMVTWLLDECKIPIETKGQYENTPFLCAVKKGRREIAKLLRQRGANIHATDGDGNNALHKACVFSGSKAMVTWLLDVCGIGIETKGRNQITPFLCTAFKGQIAIAKLLRQRGANIHATDGDGNNALHYACVCSGSKAMVTWLLDECKISIESKGKYQKTPFLCAAEKGQLAIAKLLRQKGAYINVTNKIGNNALHLACLYSGSVEMVTWLLDTCKIKIESKGNYQRTPFFYAAAVGNVAIAKLLKKRGANIKKKDKYENKALHLACLYSGSVEMVTWLLDTCKIKIELKGNYQRTPFLYAAHQGHLAVAKLLRQRGANINAQDLSRRNALHLACLFSGSVEMVTWLLDTCKIKIESKGNYQRTPFLFAAEGGQRNIAQLLRQRGADINAQDLSRRNALHFACLYSDSIPMITWLLDVCKIGIETKGQDQKTPFLFAAEGGQRNIAQLLKQKGANIHATDKSSNNALHFACLFSGSEAMVTWLLDVCKIKIESEGFKQRTPFLYAAEQGQLAIAELLIQRGADIEAKDKNGKNALRLAKKYKRKEMISYLKSKTENKGNSKSWFRFFSVRT